MSVGVVALVSLGVVSALATWGLVRVIRDLALARGLLDQPNARSSHERPTPRLGGLGILCVTVLVAGGGLATTAGTRDGLVVLGIGAAIALVSLLDDLRSLPATTRLAAHVIAAVATVAVLGPLPMPWPADGVPPAALTGVVSVVWITGFLNAFNFMDGTDGIAGVQAIVGAAAWAVVGWWLDAPTLVVLSTVVVGTSAGFLVHNWSPATIFMGDVGSAFLGYLLAVLPLLLSPTPTLWIVLLPLWPFVIDTAITLVRRWRRGESLMVAHRSHLYQRMTTADWTHASVAWLYGAMAALGAGVAVAAVTRGVPSSVPGLTLLVAGSTLLWVLTARAEARPPRRPSPPSGAGIPRA